MADARAAGPLSPPGAVLLYIATGLPAMSVQEAAHEASPTGLDPNDGAGLHRRLVALPEPLEDLGQLDTRIRIAGAHAHDLAKGPLGGLETLAALVHLAQPEHGVRIARVSACRPTQLLLGLGQPSKPRQRVSK